MGRSGGGEPLGPGPRPPSSVSRAWKTTEKHPAGLTGTEGLSRPCHSLRGKPSVPHASHAPSRSLQFLRQQIIISSMGNMEPRSLSAVSCRLSGNVTRYLIIDTNRAGRRLPPREAAPDGRTGAGVWRHIVPPRPAISLPACLPAHSAEAAAPSRAFSNLLPSHLMKLRGRAVQHQIGGLRSCPRSPPPCESELGTSD